MSRLKETAVRVLNENKMGILEDLSIQPNRRFAIELFSEEGEILITLLMEEKEIQESIQKAVKEVFPDKEAYSIYNVQNYIYFRLK